MKKTFLGLGLFVVLALGLYMTRKENVAKSANFEVSIEDEKVKKDEEFNLYVTVKSSVSMNELEAYLEYDDQVLEYVGCKQDGVTGASGTITVAQTFEEPVDEEKYVITLKALEVGKTTVTIRDIYIVDEKNSDVIEISQNQATIEITTNAEEAKDATLSDLLVFPATLATEFDSKVLTYEVTVDNDVEELIISAVPTIEESVVTIEQPKKLVVGQNTIKINVTAPSGNVKTYTILVTRKRK